MKARVWATGLLVAFVLVAQLGSQPVSAEDESQPVRCGRSAAARARIESLLFQKYLQEGGLIWSGQHWVEPKTHEITSAPNNHWTRSGDDPEHAFNSDTGQNAVYDHEKQQWIDAKTGQALSASGNSCALLEGLLFQKYLQEGGLIWSGQHWVDPKTHEITSAPNNHWTRSGDDPEHAFNSDTGQNAVYDHEKQQWIDAETGQPLSPSLK